MTLFTRDDLANYLKLEVPDSADGDTTDSAGLLSQDTYEVLEKIVDGWLSDATGMDKWPDPTPKPVFSWALELAAIAYENPAAAASDTTDQVGMSWNEQRRRAILDRAAAWGRDLPAQALIPSPTGSFPSPDRLPYALRRTRRRRYGDWRR